MNGLQIIVDSINPFFFFLFLFLCFWIIYQKKSNKNTLHIAIIIIIMILARLKYTIISKRYAISILPIIYIYLSFCINLILKKDYYCFIIGFLAILSIALICMQFTGLSPTKNSIREISQYAKAFCNKETDHIQIACLHSTDLSRICYFSQIKPDPFFSEKVSPRAKNDQDHLFLFNKYLSKIQFNNSDLLVFTEERTENNPDAIYNTLNNYGMKQISSFYTNRHKKKKWVLYLYKNDEILSTPQKNNKNKLYNGDFELHLSFDENDSFVKFFSSKGYYFDTDKSHRIPKNIIIHPNYGFSSFATPCIYLDSRNAIQGQYSLHLKTNKSICFEFRNDILPGGYTISFDASFISESQMELFFVPCNPSSLELVKIASIHSLPSRTSRYNISFPESLTEDYDHFRLAFALNYGNVLLDNFEIK